MSEQMREFLRKVEPNINEMVEGILKDYPDDCFFENGKPVNMPTWGYFKNIEKEVRAKGNIRVSSNMVVECFNSIRTPAGSLMISSEEIFVRHCERLGFDVFKDESNMTYTVINKKRSANVL